MKDEALELSTPKPNWDTGKQNVEDVLSQNYGVKPKTPEQRDLLHLAKDLHDRTREQAQPFLDALFDDGNQRYFSRLSGAAFSIKNALSPKNGEVIEKSFEQLTEDASAGIIGDLADMYDQRERLRTQGLTETGESSRLMWPQVDIEKPELAKSIEDLDNVIKDAVEAGAAQTGWLIGLRVIRAKLHNKLNLLDQEIKGKRPKGSIGVSNKQGHWEFPPKPLNPEDSKVVNEKTNQLTMEAIDDVDRALPEINKREWRERFQIAQGELVACLDVQGIRRLVPKIGESLDPKWQMATAKNGQSNRISKIGRGAFVDKSTGKVIQEAWVETG